MRLLITGAHGQLGRELVRLGGSHDLLAVDHHALDITDAGAVAAVARSFNPEVIINAAAYTAVDRAESDRDLAFAVNSDGPKILAIAAEKAGIPLIHVSTDYVFAGSKSAAYRETDPATPLGVYGKSKLAGEQAVRRYCRRHIILRTSWVFSAHGNNFVKTMLRLAGKRRELAIIANQYGCPTAAGELARGIFAVIAGGLGGKQYGLYHFCQPEPTSWHGFAETIFAEARRQGMPLALKSAKPIAAADYPTTAARPNNSVLNCQRFARTFKFEIHPWPESLAEVIREERRTEEGHIYNE